MAQAHDYTATEADTLAQMRNEVRALQFEQQAAEHTAALGEGDLRRAAAKLVHAYRQVARRPEIRRALAARAPPRRWPERHHTGILAIVGLGAGTTSFANTTHASILHRLTKAAGTATARRDEFDALLAESVAAALPSKDEPPPAQASADHEARG